MNYPKALVDSLSLIDRWEFNVFDVADASKQRPLTYVLYELIKKYDLLSTFKVSYQRVTNGKCDRQKFKQKKFWLKFSKF